MPMEDYEGEDVMEESREPSPEDPQEEPIEMAELPQDDFS